MMSGYGNAINVPQLYDSGAVTYFNKPFHPQEFRCRMIQIFNEDFDLNYNKHQLDDTWDRFVDAKEYILSQLIY